MSDKPDFKNIAQVQMDTAKDVFGIDLKFDEESILKLDDIITQGWGGEPPAMIDNMVGTFGSFLGEAIIATLGGEWAQNEQGNWVVIIPVGSDKITNNVFAKVHKRFMNGTEDSISYYYQMLKKMVNEGVDSVIGKE